MMLLFFATIGAGAGSLMALRSTGWLTAFIAIQLGVHMAVILLGGYVLAGLPMQVRLSKLHIYSQHTCLQRCSDVHCCVIWIVNRRPANFSKQSFP